MKHVLRKKFVFLAVILLCVTPHALLGQAVNGGLVGSVTDATGSAVPNATITVTEASTSVSRTAQTNESGNFVFSDVTPGTYNVAAEFQGFKKQVRQNVLVLVNTTVRVDLQLQAGDVRETVNVTAEIPMLKTDRADTGRTLETKQVADIPLGFNRNFQGLLNLVPGTTRSFRPHSEFFNPQDSLSTQVNGQSRLANNLQFEGVDDQHRTGLLQVLIPPIEAIQTVDVSTSNYDAELGRAGGAVTNVILKSGTNNFHGAVYEFNRVSALASRSFFTRLPATKPGLTYNYYGANIGGPIRKNKTFFFGDFLRINERRGQTNNNLTVPIAAWRNGDFSSSKTTIFDPSTGNPDGSGRTAFPGNKIPDPRISAVAKRIVALVPPPNQSGVLNNFSKNTTLSKDSTAFDVKVDQNQSDKSRFSVRYSYFKPTVIDPPIYGLAGGPHNGGFQATGTEKTHNGAVNYNRTFSPTLLTELRLGISRYRNEAQNSDFGTKASDAIGIPGVNVFDFTSGLSSIEIDGISNPMVGYSASLPWIRAETNINIVNHWTKALSNHTVKWGVDIRRIRDDLLQTQSFNPRGVFRYGQTTTGLKCPPAPVACDRKTSFPNAFASFLLDVPREVGRDFPIVFPTYRATEFFAFGNDRWQVSPKLTLDLGLRWEFYPPATPRFAGGFSNYDFTTNSLVVAGVGSNPSNLGRSTRYKDFAPRVGIAYRLGEKGDTVLRGGFGLSYEPFPDNTYAYNFPVKQNNSFNNNTNNFGPALLTNGSPASLAAGFPPPTVAAIPSNGVIPATGLLLNQSYDVINLNFREPYVESWNLAIQRALPHNFTFEAAYVANHGVDIATVYNLNAVTDPAFVGKGSAGQPLFQRFGRTSGTDLRFVGTSSHYHSLQAKFDHRSSGFLLTTSYTYSKATGTTDESGGFAYYVNQRRSYSTLNFSRTHTFVQSYVYELPFGKGKPYWASGVASAILGGWELSGVLTLMTGQPLNFGVSGGRLNTPGNSLSPNINGPFRKTYGIDTQPWFDTSVFSKPPDNAFGNIGRFVFSGPGFFNLDAALFRRVPLTEKLGLELRAEGFSVTNTPQFDRPNTSQGADNFGLIKGAGGNRSIDFGVKLTF